MEQLSKIRIAGKTIFYKKWFDAGVQNIDDVLTIDFLNTAVLGKNSALLFPF